VEPPHEGTAGITAGEEAFAIGDAIQANNKKKDEPVQAFLDGAVRCEGHREISSLEQL
jgi:hypothetical protein